MLTRRVVVSRYFTPLKKGAACQLNSLNISGVFNMFELDIFFPLLPGLVHKQVTVCSQMQIRPVLCRIMINSLLALL